RPCRSSDRGSGAGRQRAPDNGPPIRRGQLSNQGRLRVFSDGTAGAWIPGVGLIGFDEADAAPHQPGAPDLQTREEPMALFPAKGLPATAPPVSEAEELQGPLWFAGEYAAAPRRCLVRSMNKRRQQTRHS